MTVALLVFGKTYIRCLVFCPIQYQSEYEIFQRLDIGIFHQSYSKEKKTVNYVPKESPVPINCPHEYIYPLLPLMQDQQRESFLQVENEKVWTPHDYHFLLEVWKVCQQILLHWIYHQCQSRHCLVSDKNRERHQFKQIEINL